MEMSEDVKNTRLSTFYTAFSKLQGDLRTVPFDSSVRVKSKTGAEFGYSYASLTAICEAIREPMKQHGFGYNQKIYSRDGKYFVETIISHSCGWCVNSGELELRLANSGMQDLGSASTYAKRYQLCALLGLASDEDDDGTRADNKPSQAQPKKPTWSPPAVAPPANQDPFPPDDLDQALQAFDEPDRYWDKKPTPKQEPSIVMKVTMKQLTRLFAIMKSREAFGWNEATLKSFINTVYGLESSKALDMNQYQEVCKLMETTDFEKALEMKLKPRS